MFDYRRLGWLIFVPGLVACGDGGATDAEEDALLSTRASAVVSPPTQDDVCSSHRWVGVSAGGQCPPSVPVWGGAGTWEQTWLTGGVAPSAPGLAKFCAYTWRPSSPATADPDPYVAALPYDAGRPGVVWLSEDCQVIAPLGNPAVPVELGVGLNAQLLAQVDAPAGREASPNTPPARIQLDVLDTAPYSEVGRIIPGRNGHGYTLLRLIENVTCPRSPDGAPTGKCLTPPQSMLAMPYVAPDVMNRKEGGHSGTPWTLASAITRSVERFIKRATSNDANPRERLILNMSLGWEPRWGGAYSVSGDELKGSIRALHQTLVYARCHGALAFAASGNAPGGPEEAIGALYPARWEEKPVPDCAEFAATMNALPYKPFPDTGYRPLVHAVGGVDGADNVVRGARLGSMPRLAAPATLAAGVVPKGTIVGNPGGGWRVTSAPESTRVLTGTSVSTALVSAAAQTIWSYRPELSTSQVVQILVDSGMDLHQPPQLPATTSTCLGGHACLETPHRMSICSAFEMACSSGAPRCPTLLPTCAKPPPYAGKVSMLTPDAFAALESGWLPSLKLDGSACKETVETPDMLFFGTQVAPRIAPQPGDHPCLACYVVIDPTAAVMDVVISIDPRATAELSSPAVLAYAARTAKPLNTDLSSALKDTLVPGTHYRVNEVPLDMPVSAIPSLSSVRLSFQVLSDPTALEGRVIQSVTQEVPFYVH